jgi:choline dehydrogenase
MPRAKSSYARARWYRRKSCNSPASATARCCNREYGGVRLLGNMLNYMVRGKGPMARAAAEAIAFVRAHPASVRPDTQIMFNPYSLAASTAGLAFEQEPGMQCYSYMLRPTSEGSALISAASADAPLAIRTAYLESEIDQQTSIAGTRAIRRIMEQDALKHLVVGETDKTAGAQSDDEILGLYKTIGHSGYHAVGTAAMGPNDDDVVDARLRVRGVSGLRVVDCSVFREIPSGNTNAPAMAAAWRLAEMIIEDAQ